MDIKCTEFAENAEYTKIYSAGVCLQVYIYLLDIPIDRVPTSDQFVVW